MFLRFSVRLGEHDVNTEIDCDFKIYCAPLPIDIEIKKKIVHEHYNADDMLSDIALLRLKHKVNQTDFIKPICLPLSSELRNNTFEGVRATVAGWGKTEDNIKSHVKLKVKVQYLLSLFVVVSTYIIGFLFIGTRSTKQEL